MEKEKDIEEDFMVGSDNETDSEDGNTVERLAHEDDKNDRNRVFTRTLPEPICDESKVLLSWYDSDLNLVIDENTFSSAFPIHWKGFCYLQGGVRATHGFTSGRVCFEVKLTNLLKPYFDNGHLNTHIIRVGWSPTSVSLALGSDRKSYGYDSNGRASTRGEIKDYGKTFSAGDVIGAYLDLNERPVTISFTVNGIDQGIAYTVPHYELSNEALFPHVLSKNIAFECNFGSKSSWFTPRKGYTFVNDTPMKERIPGPRTPKNADDCEVIMMIGLPRSGKTTWAREFCAKNHGKYYILDILSLVDKMELMDPSRKAIYLKKSQVQGKLFKLAALRRRNYILDQINAMRYEWEWKLKLFKDYQVRAVVCVVPDEELERRINNEPLVKGRGWLMVLKARISIPRPSYALSRIDYVGLPWKEARRLLKRYNREAWVQGFKPHKHFVVPPYLFHMKSIIKKKLNLKKERITDPVAEPSGRGEITPLRKMTETEMPSSKKESLDGPISFVPEGIHNESSLKPFQEEFKNRNPSFQGNIDHPRKRQLTSEFEANRRWPSRNIVYYPPKRKSTQQTSSLSPVKNIASGRGFPPEHGGRQDFPESTSQQNVRPLQREGQGGWRPPNRGIDRDLSPPRGVGGGRQVNEFAGRGMQVSPVFPPQMQGTKMLDCAGPREGRVELGFQMQNRPRSFSPNRSGSVQCDPKFVDLRPEGRVSGHLSSQNLRQRDCFPPTRERSMGEEIIEKDYAQRQRMAGDFPPQGARRDCGDGYQHMEGHFGGKFPPQESRVYNSTSTPIVLEERRGRFPEVRDSRDDHPHKERYREGRNEFPSHDGRQRGSFSPQRDQRMSRGEGREIPLNEQRMSVEGLPPFQGRGDTFPYHESRMEDKIIQNRVRTSNNDIPICGEKMIMDSGERRSDNMSSSAPELVPQEGRFYGDGHQHLTRNEGREHPIADPLARDSRGVGIMPKIENRLEINLHPHRSSPHREERPGGGWLPSEVGHFGGKQPGNPENSEWNRKRQADRDLPDFAPQDGKWPYKGEMRYPGRDGRPPEQEWGKDNNPVLDPHLDSNFPLNEEERRAHSDRLSGPFKSELVGDFTSSSSMTGVLTTRFEDDRKNPQSMKNRDNWKDATHSSGWQSSTDVCGDWKKGPSNVGPIKELPFQKGREDNVIQPGSTNRSHFSHKSPLSHLPHSGPKGHLPPRWGSRSPEYRGKIGLEDGPRLSPGPEHGGFPSSRSPVHGGPRRSPHLRESPVHDRRLSPRGSPGRDSRRSPFHGSRDLPVRGTRRSPGPGGWGRKGSPDHFRVGSPDHHRRGSPVHHRRGSPVHHRRGSLDHHRRGSPDHHRRGSPEQFRRGSPDQFIRGRPRGSPFRGSRGSRGRGRRGSLNAPYRESPNRDSRGPRGSPIRRSRSPISRPLSSSGRVRRGSPIHSSLRSPDRNLRASPVGDMRGSPIPWKNSPSSMSRSTTRHHLTSHESRNRFSPSRPEWHSPTGRNGNKLCPGEEMNRINQQEFPPHFDPSFNLPPNTEDRDHFPYDREGNADSWPSEEFRDQNDFEIKDQRFTRHHSSDRTPQGFNPTSNVDVARTPFVHDRLGPKLADDDMIVPYEGGPDDTGRWDPHGGEVRANRSPRGSSCSSGGSCWERVPGSQSGNRDLDDLAPYEQPFTQALWDSKDPPNDSFRGGNLEFPRNDLLLPEANRGENQEQPPEKENRGNVWARVGGYVNDDNDPREDTLGHRETPPPLDRRSPPRNMPGSSRRWSREREGKLFRNSGRRSPGRRESPPGRSSRWESKRFAPYPERRRTPPKSGPRSHWKSPPRKGDRRSPPRRRGLRSPPRRW